MVLLSTIMAISILGFDLSLPLGVAAGVPYVSLVLLGWWFPRPGHIHLLAAAGRVLTIVGYVASPDGGIAWIVLSNRLLAVFAIWVTASLLVMARRAQAFAISPREFRRKASSASETSAFAHSSRRAKTPFL